ncbi:hypothetical protein B7486_73910, partial [cyanobacterium TDX16]
TEARHRGRRRAGLAVLVRDGDVHRRSLLSGPRRATARPTRPSRGAHRASSPSHRCRSVRIGGDPCVASARVCGRRQRQAEAAVAGAQTLRWRTEDQRQRPDRVSSGGRGPTRSAIRGPPQLLVHLGQAGGASAWAEAVELAEAHDQRTPSIGVDLGRGALVEDRRVSVHGDDAQLDGHHVRRHARIAVAERRDRLDDG